MDAKVSVNTRWMIRRDMGEALACDASPTAPTEDDVLAWTRQRNCIAMVAERGEDVVGVVIYELHRTGLHVLHLAVHPRWRRRGVGRQMVAKLLSKVKGGRRTHVTAECGDHNLAAHLFLKSAGFAGAALTRDRYLFTWGPPGGPTDAPWHDEGNEDYQPSVDREVNTNRLQALLGGPPGPCPEFGGYHAQNGNDTTTDALEGQDDQSEKEDESSEF